MVLAACVLASSMAFIDGSALTVALPKLRAFFGADLATVQWVLNGYVLALAALTLIGGALADHYGKARMLAIGCVGFGLSSAACVVAPSIEWLIACRVAQGVSAAIADTGEFGTNRRNLSEGRSAAAPSVCGLPLPRSPPRAVRSSAVGLTENYGWQWVFAINPPLAARGCRRYWSLTPRPTSMRRAVSMLRARRFLLSRSAVWLGRLVRSVRTRVGQAGRMIALQHRRRRRGACCVRVVGTPKPISDDPAKADRQSALRRPEHRDAAHLHWALDHVLSVVLRSCRPTRPITDKRRACLFFLSRSASVFYRDHSVRWQTRLVRGSR